MKRGIRQTRAHLPQHHSSNPSPWRHSRNQLSNQSHALLDTRPDPFAAKGCHINERKMEKGTNLH